MALEVAMWTNSSAVFRLTYKTRYDDAVFCPDLVMKKHDKRAFSQGRNALLLAARLQELRQGWAYGYYIFMDGDVRVDGPGSWGEALAAFQGFLHKWEPAIGVPLYHNEENEILITHLFNREQDSKVSDVRSISWFDQLFVAIHREAA